MVLQQARSPLTKLWFNFRVSHPFLTNLQRFFISAGSGPRVVKRPGGARLCPHPEAPPPPPRRRRRAAAAALEARSPGGKAIESKLKTLANE